MITPEPPRPPLYGPFGLRISAALGKLLARLRTAGLLRTLGLIAAYAAAGAAAVPVASGLWFGPSSLLGLPAVGAPIQTLKPLYHTKLHYLGHLQPLDTSSLIPPVKRQKTVKA